MAQKEPQMSKDPQMESRLILENITDGADVLRAERAALQISGVQTARVRLDDGRIDLCYGTAAQLPQVAAALKSAGFAPKQSRQTLMVDGMTCGACTARVEKILNAQNGLFGAQANLATRRVAFVGLEGSYDLDFLAQKLTKAGYSASLLNQEKEGTQKDQAETALYNSCLLASIVTFPIFLVEMGGHLYAPIMDFVHTKTSMQGLWTFEFFATLIVLSVPGRHFFKKGFPSLWRGAPDMNSLVALGTCAAFLYSATATFTPALLPQSARAVYYEAAMMIVVLVLWGRFFEGRSRGRAGQSIAKLAALQPKTARKLTPEGVVVVPVAGLRIGDRVSLLPGERVPADGQVLDGYSYISESMVTGEAMPILKTSGETVIGGTVNGEGSLTVIVTAVGQGSVLARIITMVEQAQSTKLPVQALVDRITLWFVPLVLVVALMTCVIWLWFGPSLGSALVAGVSVLIIACPCAMGLATPISIILGTGRAAELGVLFRQGAALQTLSEVTVIGFDKTGTLTQGVPHVVNAHLKAANHADEDGLWSKIFAVESLSEHPLAQALCNYAQSQGAALVGSVVSEFVALPGLGVSAKVGVDRILIGQAGLFDPEALCAHTNHAKAYEEKAQTPVFASINGDVCVVFALADPIKPSAKAAIVLLKSIGIRPFMLTGDVAGVAGAIGEELEIDDIQAKALPQDKLAYIAKLQAQGVALGFVGDGINDAPALAAADVGLALGTGTDIAMDAAQIILVSRDLRAVINGVKISRLTMRNIKQNLAWAFGYNVVLIPVAAGALVPFGGPQLSPILAAGAMALSSIFVLINAARLRRIPSVNMDILS